MTEADVRKMNVALAEENRLKYNPRGIHWFIGNEEGSWITI